MSGVQDSQDCSILLASSDEGRDLLSVRFTQKKCGSGFSPCTM